MASICGEESVGWIVHNNQMWLRKNQSFRFSGVHSPKHSGILENGTHAHNDVRTPQACVDGKRGGIGVSEKLRIFHHHM